MKADKTYFNFLDRQSGEFPEIDLTARQLLDTIGQFEETPFTVTEAMTLFHIASPATIHRKLEELLLHGYVEKRMIDNNRRSKYLFLTQRSINAYNALGRAMRGAVNGK